MSEHTKGPWHLILSDNATPHIMHGEYFGCEDHDHLICHLPAEIMINYNSLNNARLIAAAPELLGALEDMYRNGRKQNWGSHYENSMDLAAAAIAKAKGEKEWNGITT